MLGADREPLLVRLAAGEERAFAELYGQFAARLYRLALRLLGRPVDAEDAVQQVFVSLMRSRARLADVDDLTAYAVYRYRAAQGRWPEQLSDLVPQQLEAAPRDVFDGKPVRLKVTGSGGVVYSIGPDLRDNGGKPYHYEDQTGDLGFRFGKMEKSK